MDYSELLLAAQVRKIAIGRIKDRTPPHLDEAQKREFLIAQFPDEARAFLRELQEVSAMLKE
jgi:alpha-D-ribose 1-methylphosphonate 5-triphosphate diphosphatase PhnM